MTRDVRLDAFEGRLGYRFKDRALLERALTHKSRGDGQRGSAVGSRYQFGDSSTREPERRIPRSRHLGGWPLDGVFVGRD